MPKLSWYGRLVDGDGAAASWAAMGWWVWGIWAVGWLGAAVPPIPPTFLSCQVPTWGDLFGGYRWGWVVVHSHTVDFHCISRTTKLFLAELGGAGSRVVGGLGVGIWHRFLGLSGGVRVGDGGDGFFVSFCFFWEKSMRWGC